MWFRHDFKLVILNELSDLGQQIAGEYVLCLLERRSER